MIQLRTSSFSARLKQYRSDRELTQGQLGQLLGVSQVAIATYERGDRFPRPATLAAISRLFGLTLDELLASRASDPPSDNAARGEAVGLADFSAERLLALLLREPTNRAFALTTAWKRDLALPLAGIYEQALIPLLALIGRLWQQGELSVAEEHLLSEKVRELAILHASAEPAAKPGRGKEPGTASESGPAREADPSSTSFRWMGLCAPGEKHDLALFMYSLVLRQAGWHTWYLGTQVPLADLIAAIEANQPRVLGLSVTLSENTEALELYARQVRARFGPRPAIIVGGQGAAHPGTGLVASVDAFATSLVSGLALAERFATSV